MNSKEAIQSLKNNNIAIRVMTPEEKRDFIRECRDSIISSVNAQGKLIQNNFNKPCYFAWLNGAKATVLTASQLIYIAQNPTYKGVKGYNKKAEKNRKIL